MKSLVVIATCAAGMLGIASSCSENRQNSTPELEWSALNIVEDSLPPHYIQKFVLTGDLRGVERLAFNQFARRMELTDSADTLIEIVPGYYAIGSPRFKNASGNDTIVFEIDTRGTISSICYGPDGTHLVMNDGRTVGLDIKRADMTAVPEGYSIPGHDRMPYGDTVYSRNEQISGAVRGAYDVIPSFKKVTLGGADTEVDFADIKFIDKQAGENPEAFVMTVSNGTVTVEAPAKQHARIGERLRAAFGTGRRTMPEARIEDEPSFGYRGLMLDISRNYQTPEEVKRVLTLMARFGLNVFHFHPVDDEAWRLEIPSLPELMEIGAGRGYTPGSDGTFLEQIFTGDGNPANTSNSSNGKFTRADYVDMLRFADSLGIKVITEIESPGHARAAIKAMELRARRTGDNSWLINEGAATDTSRYTSAQSFHDNVMNPALPGSYKLMEAVADDIIAAYKEAGVELPAIHIGGDEVPRGAWQGSPAVKKLMEENGLRTEKDVHGYFVKKVADIFNKKGVKISGWQDIGLGQPAEYNAAVAPEVYNVNCWTVAPRTGVAPEIEAMAKGGYPIVLSNVTHFYLDMTYSYHPYERGLSWGGTVDEFDALAGYPARLCPLKNANVLGVQGQIFAETLRDSETLEVMMLPKMLGLAERAWNPDSTYSEAEFHAAVLPYINRWEQEGIRYHVRQPGIKLTQGHLLLFNSPYPDADIRYTTDGSNPDISSPIAMPGETVDIDKYPVRPTQIRAAVFLNGHPSPVSILNI